MPWFPQIFDNWIQDLSKDFKVNNNISNGYIQGTDFNPSISRRLSHTKNSLSEIIEKLKHNLKDSHWYFLFLHWDLLSILYLYCYKAETIMRTC